MTSQSNPTSVALKKLYEWWAAPSTVGDTTSFLDAGFEYDDRGAAHDGQFWIWLVQQSLPWSELRIVGTVVDGDKGALVFEGVEGVTLLRHRIAWLVEVRAGRVIKLVATSQILP